MMEQSSNESPARQSRLVQCLFYSHVWTTHLLRHAGLGNFNNAVLAELAVVSNLAVMFRQQAQMRLGLAGLLAHRNCLDKLGTNYPILPAPLILAPDPAVPAAALESAVSLLSTTTASYDKVTLLVHMNDAPAFANAYHHVDQFSILWDIADPPTGVLECLASVLADNDCITPQRWCGLHLCNHPLRALAAAGERRALLQSVLDEFPRLQPAA
jgi:hypothetical protein